MNKTTMDNVIKYWLNNQPAINTTKNLKSDGLTLIYYETPIGETDEFGEKKIFNYTAKGLGFITMKTSQLVNKCFRLLQLHQKNVRESLL